MDKAENVEDEEIQFGKCLPSWIRKALGMAIEDDLQKQADRLIAKIERMKEIKKEEGTRGKSDEWYDNGPEHMKRVQGHLDLFFHLRMMEEAGISEGCSESYKRNWKEGPNINGEEVGKTGAFEERDEPKKSNQNMKKASEWRKHPIEFPTKPFEFMKKKNVKRQWEEFKQRIGINLREIKKEEVKTCPIRSFGVEQGDYEKICGERVYNKLRSCWDFRGPNAYCDQTEKLKLYGYGEVMTMLAAMRLGNPEVATPVVQSKHDVKMDMNEEMRRKMMWNERPKGRKVEKKKEGCNGRILKLDKKGYYNQFGLRNPELVTYAMWDSEKESFRFFECECCDFGSIHAIWWCQRVAQANMKLICGWLGIPCIVYIDDTVLVMPQGKVWRVKDGEETQVEIEEIMEEAVQTFYDLTGFKMSTGKRESLTEDGTIKVLGVEFSDEKDGDGLKARVPDVKIEEFNEKLNEVLQGLKKEELTTKVFEEAHGKGCFLASVGRGIRQARVKALAFFSVKENLFYSLNKFGKTQIRRAVERARDEATRVRPILIKEKTLRRKVATIATDATGGDPPHLGGLVDETKEGWKVSLCKARHFFWKRSLRGKDKVKDHVGIFEMLAVLITAMKEKESIKGRKAYIYVDNIGVVRILTKGTSRCLVSQAIATVIIDFLFEIDCSPYYIYINTKVNPADNLTRIEIEHLVHNLVPGLKLKDFGKGGKDFEGIWSELSSKCECELRDLVNTSGKDFYQHGKTRKATREDDDGQGKAGEENAKDQGQKEGRTDLPREGEVKRVHEGLPGNFVQTFVGQNEEAAPEPPRQMAGNGKRERAGRGRKKGNNEGEAKRLCTGNSGIRMEEADGGRLLRDGKNLLSGNRAFEKRKRF